LTEFVVMPVMGRIVCRLRGHRWHYGGTGAWTGYIETCARCGETVQVPQ
jgi:hypothetical protein